MKGLKCTECNGNFPLGGGHVCGTPAPYSPDAFEVLHERINALERRLQETHDLAIQALAMAGNPIRLT